MQSRSIAVIGFGDLGERLCHVLDPGRWRCHGLRRSVQALPAGVRPVPVDLEQPASLQVLERIAPDALLVTLSPSERTADGYTRGFDIAMESILAGLGSHRPAHAFFVSSTRVYAEADGGWVDEDSALDMQNPFASAIISAERRFLEGLPSAVVLRAGGLYGGSGPGQLLKRVAAGRLTPRTPSRYGNRIHRDDVVGFVSYALEHDVDERIINLVDDSPAALQEVEAWLCSGLGKPYEPAEEEPDAAPPSHKRISNQRLRATGYALRYADFRAGYGDVLRRWMAHSEREDGLDLH